MFTEGLDPHALRWVRQGTDPLSHTSKTAIAGGRVAGGPRVPPPEKFRSGHLPRGAVPFSAIHKSSLSDSCSDMDESTDTEAEIQSFRYSVNSSPQQDIPARRDPLAASNYVPAYYSSDFSDISTSRDNKRPYKQHDKRNPARHVEEEEEQSDSAGSSFSSQPIRVNGCVKGSYKDGYTDSRRNYEADLSAPSEAGIASKVNGTASQRNYKSEVKAASETETCSNTPSAPPISSYDQEIRQDANSNDFDHNVSNLREEPTPVVEESNVADQKPRAKSSSSPEGGFSSSYPARVPTYHASVQGPWCSLLAYDACVRLCLHSWARGCMEAPVFLENECLLLRNSFGLQHVLLQPEEELLTKRSTELATEGTAPKPRKTIGKMKVQVRKVRMSLDMPHGCSSLSSFRTPAIKLDSIKYRLSNVQSTLSSGWDSVKRVRVLPQLPVNSSFSRHSLAYMHAGAQYIKEVSGLLKMGVTTLRNSSSYDIAQETYSCQLRLKSSAEDDWVRMQPGSGETHVFLPDSLGDDLIVDVYDSKGKSCGRVVAQVATVAEDPTNKVHWWSIYREPEHELVGRIQLYINYTTSPDENNPLKYVSIAETVAYDVVLEVAMKAQHFQQRNLILHGQWKWLLTEFASYYGVSDSYTRLRYLSYVMDVATPTADCITLIYELLSPVVICHKNNTLSHQENRILGEVEEQNDQLLAMSFENYKSLDESLQSGMAEVFRSPSGSPAPALGPAVNLYKLLHDIFSPEAQLKLCGYFQIAARKRVRQLLHETDEYVAGNADINLMDVLTFTTAYRKMISLCHNIRDEIFTDIQIHNRHVLPSFIDLPNLAASIYTSELSGRLRDFLMACPPTGPTPPVADLMIATADLQKDVASWNIGPVKGGVDAKELFHLYIMLWIQDKRLALLESCKLDKVKWSGVSTEHMTTPFVDDMYDRLRETLTEYEVIICRWPEYTFELENAIAAVEKAVIEALEKQYSDVLAPLKDCLTPKKFGLKYVQKLAKRKSTCPFTVTEELGIVLNSMKRLLDVLRPRIETQLKSWGSCIPDGSGSTTAGEKLSEFTVSLRNRFRNYLQAVVEKLAENTRMQNTTKLKKIIQDSKEMVMDVDIKSRMQALNGQLTDTINRLHKVFEVHVFVLVSRGLWERMGKDVLSFLENRKENRAWYRGARVAVAVLNDTFASQMQQLLGNSVQEKDLEPPSSIREVRSILCKDARVQKDSGFYY